MKNLYLLPTEKPSRLIWYTTGRYHLLKEPIFIDAPLKPSRHIYITSDEEIKEGDWCIEFTPNNEKITELFKCNEEQVLNISTGTDYKYKKIILTTHPDLIKNGVQSIDDEFLEWFVKNPNCNFVRAIKVPYFDESSYSYVLIIPIEEDFELVSIGEETVKLAIPMIQDREEIKQETLEEVVWKLAKQKFEEKCNYKPNLANPQDLLVMSSIQEGILIGAKWQKEQNVK